MNITVPHLSPTDASVASDIAESLANRTNSLAAAQGLVFDGTAGATVANVPIFGTGDWTVVAWATPTSITSGFVCADASSDIVPLYLSSGNWLYGDGTVGGQTLGAATANKAAMLAVTRSTGTVQAYKDGVAFGSSFASAANRPNAIAKIGSDGAGTGSFFSGSLRVLIYNRALSAAEVTALYEQGAPAAKDYPSLIGGSVAATTATSGSLVVGVRYRLTDWITGDDFTNVGAGSNADGVEFVATGTTPTTWTNSSVVTTLGLVLAPDAQQAGAGLVWYDTSGNAANITLPASGVEWVLPSSQKTASGWTFGGNLSSTGLAVTGKVYCTVADVTYGLYVQGATGKLRFLGYAGGNSYIEAINAAENSSQPIVILATTTTISNPSVGTQAVFSGTGLAVTGALSATGVYSQTTGSAANVFVDSNGDLKRSTSSLKYKTDVRDYTRGLDALMSLRPVFYKGKAKSDEGRQFAGLIAEEVHDAGLTEFVQYDKDGKPDALAYQNMIALLVSSSKELVAELKALRVRVAALEASHA